MSTDIHALKLQLEENQRLYAAAQLERLRQNNDAATQQISSSSAPALPSTANPLLPAGGYSTVTGSSTQLPVRPGGTAKQHELELEVQRLISRNTVLEKEASVKDSELHKSLQESRALRSGMEKVIRELLEKNKALDDDARRKISNAEDVLKAAISERDKYAFDAQQQRREASQLQSELLSRQSEIATAKATNQHLVAEVEELHSRLAELEQSEHAHAQEAEGLRRAEDDTRHSLDLAIEKLDKADKHIQQLSDEAAHTSIELIKYRHEVESATGEVLNQRKEREEFSLRVGQLVLSVAEACDIVTAECDMLVDTAKAQQQTSSRGGGGGDQHQGGGSKRLLHKGRLAAAAAAVNAANDDDEAANPGRQAEVVALTTLMRIRDALSLSRDDISVASKAFVEYGRHNRELQRRQDILAEAIQQERQSLIEGAERLASAEDALVEERKKCAAAEQSLLDATQWMEEAAKLGDERTRRTEALLKENLDLETALDNSRRDAQLATRRAQKQAEEATDAIQTLRNVERERDLAIEESTRIKNQLHALSHDHERLVGHAEELERETRAMAQHHHQSDADQRFHRKQLEDYEAKLRNVQKQLSMTEDLNSQLRDKLFETQKRLDAALRNNGLSSQSSTTAAADSVHQFSRLTAAAATTPGDHHQGGVNSSSPTPALFGSPTPAGRKHHHAHTGGSSLGSAVKRSEHALSVAMAASPQQRGNSKARGGRMDDGGGGGGAASLDKVRDWESRINALLGTRGTPT